jgi:hypothetical protein
MTAQSAAPLTEAVTVEEYHAAMKKSRSKYGAKRTEVDGVTFASKAEARRYGELKLMERAGEIENLTLQPRYRLDVNGVKVCAYVGDFFYYRIGQKGPVVEDVKGVSTPVYRIKKRLMKAIYGIDIVEIR